MDIQEINEIDFGILSEEEILQMSVVEVTKTKLFTTSKQKETLSESLYDLRMGPMETKQICPTCNLKTKDCPGHFGHIVLCMRIVHPLYYRHVVDFLKCFCIQCSRLLITKDHLQLWGISRYSGEQRFSYIIKQIIKIKFCSSCNVSQPKYTLILQEGSFFASFKKHTTVEKIKLSVDEIYSIFCKISDSDVRLLGFDPSKTHPKNLIVRVLPVLPPRSRPFIVTDNIICDDDLTISYSEILKINQQILNTKLSDPKRQKLVDTLVFRVKSLMDNSNMRAKHTNSRPIKGFKERLCGKDGLIRSNLMGKRGNFSARTVIGPDPTLRLNELAVPPSVCETLSYCVTVNSRNIDHLQQQVWEGKVNMIDKLNTEDDQSLNRIRRIHTEYALQNEHKETICKLSIGDRVHRQLDTGDVVLLNRQPTLHKGSMLAKRIVKRKGKTFRMNLATTGSFNADFDGDEMNIFVPQSEDCRAELEMLSLTEHNIIGTQTSGTVITIVQDALLSSYVMTRNNHPIPKHEFFQLCMSCDTELNTPGGIAFERIERKLSVAQRVFNKFNKPLPLFCGKTLFSLLLPDDFTYTSTNRACKEEPVVRIYKGILYEGSINKVNLKSGQSSLITLLCKEYDKETVLHFINNVQFLANAYILYHGFSVGIQDCVAQRQSGMKINEIITRCSMEAQLHEETVMNPVIREAKVNMSLSKAKDIGMKIATESLSETNNFITTVSAGSKGDYFNIAQIMGILGQQNISGKRVQCHLNRGTRTLPHYPFKIPDKETEYNSRGFIRNSFLKGLTPQEFWFHAMSGREGITDTAMKTAKSGYTQRKMVKIMEDVQVKYDNTVRNSVGTIIQFAYGDDNLCGSKTVLENGTPTICNIDRLVQQLNNRYELQQDII